MKTKLVFSYQLNKTKKCHLIHLSIRNFRLFYFTNGNKYFPIINEKKIKFKSLRKKKINLRQIYNTICSERKKIRIEL